MRILHAVNEIVDSGNGISNVAVDVAIMQRRRGHEVEVATSGGGFESLLEDEGVPVRRLTFDASPKAALQALPAFRSLVSEFRPDVVHAHTVTPCLVARAVRAIPRTPSFTLVATVHNVYQRSAQLMALADTVVGVAPQVEEAIRKWRVRPGSTATVTNGVLGSPRREKDERRSLDLGPRSIVAVGAVSHRKGVDVLAEAFDAIARDFPDLHLWFVGNKDWTEFVDSRSAGEFASRVHFPGLDTRPGDYMRAADIVAVASRREGLPLSLIEARDCGAAIVAAETDGAREGLDEGRAGILVPPGQPDALAGALREVLGDPARATELRERSRRDLQRFSVETMAEEYLALYPA